MAKIWICEVCGACFTAKHSKYRHTIAFHKHSQDEWGIRDPEGLYFHSQKEWERLVLQETRLEDLSTEYPRDEACSTGSDDHSVEDDDHSTGDEPRSTGGDAHSVGDDAHSVGDDDHSVGDDDNSAGEACPTTGSTGGEGDGVHPTANAPNKPERLGMPVTWTPPKETLTDLYGQPRLLGVEKVLTRSVESLLYPCRTSDEIGVNGPLSLSPTKSTKSILESRTVDQDKKRGSALTPEILQEMLNRNNDLLAQKMEEKMEKKMEARMEEKIGALVPYVEKGLQSEKDGSKDGKDGKGAGDEDDKEQKIDIVCLAKGDYVKKIIQIYDGDEEKAMNYIKNVGIATDFLEGDFRMIKKIYFDGKKKSQFPIRVKDFSRKKLEYLEENGEWVLDIRGEIVGKRLCDNIVKTLLIANNQFNEVIINEPDEDRKAVLLDLFQINKTQTHIMKLMERKTQGKMTHRVAEFIIYCAEVQAETGSLENVEKAYE